MGKSRGKGGLTLVKKNGQEALASCPSMWASLGGNLEGRPKYKCVPSVIPEEGRSAAQTILVQ